MCGFTLPAPRSRPLFFHGWLGEEVPDKGRCLPVLLGQRMCIKTHRERWARMSKTGLNRLEIDPIRDGLRRLGVAQLVKLKSLESM